MSETSDAEAILTAINAQLTGTGRQAYEMTDPDVKALTVDHVVVITSRRYVPEQLGSGEVPLPGGRVMTRYVAKTTGNLRLMREKTTTALEDRILPSGVGPFTFETDEQPNDDDGWVTGADVWTY